MLVGLAVVGLLRWRAAAWAVVLATLVLFPLYGYSALNSTRLMWWTRRYVPTVLPGIVVLIALAITFLLVWHWRGRLLSAATGAVALVGLLALFLSQSLPLRAHDEFAGSFALAEQIAAVAGERDGVFLWEADQGCCSGPTRLLATPVWLQHGQLSALLPNDAALAVDGNARTTVLDRYADRFAGRPLFVVADGGQLPAGIDPARVQPVLDRQVRLPVWEESDVESTCRSRRSTCPCTCRCGGSAELLLAPRPRLALAVPAWPLADRAARGGQVRDAHHVMAIMVDRGSACAASTLRQA